MNYAMETLWRKDPVTLLKYHTSVCIKGGKSLEIFRVLVSQRFTVEWVRGTHAQSDTTRKAWSCSARAWTNGLESLGSIEQWWHRNPRPGRCLHTDTIYLSRDPMQILTNLWVQCLNTLETIIKDRTRKKKCTHASEEKHLLSVS